MYLGVPDWKFMCDAHVMINKTEGKRMTVTESSKQVRRIRERRQEEGRPTIVGNRGTSSQTRIPIVDTHHPGIQGMRPPWSRYNVKESKSKESQQSEGDSSK